MSCCWIYLFARILLVLQVDVCVVCYYITSVVNCYIPLNRCIVSYLSYVSVVLPVRATLVRMWHDSCIRMCDMTPSICVTCKCATWLLQHTCVWHDSCIHMWDMTPSTYLQCIHMWDMTPSTYPQSKHGTWFTGHVFLCATWFMYSYVRHDSFHILVVHIWNMTHAFICGTWRIRSNDLVCLAVLWSSVCWYV